MELIQKRTGEKNSTYSRSFQCHIASSSVHVQIAWVIFSLLGAQWRASRAPPSGQNEALHHTPLHHQIDRCVCVCVHCAKWRCVFYSQVREMWLCCAAHDKEKKNLLITTCLHDTSQLRTVPNSWKLNNNNNINNNDNDDEVEDDTAFSGKKKIIRRKREKRMAWLKNGVFH